ncbi:MAG TPA: flagellar protein FlaG [Armatimonadota bacterium]|nr:flagellar protein FlaG [Armatimonadota bacterium]
MTPLEPLPSQLPAPPTPVPARSPAAGRSAYIPPALSGRQLRRELPAPLQASVRFEKLARQVVLALLEPETGRVVRQIPPEKILKMIVYLQQAADSAFDKSA